jgi:predicted anti-sigma-YlaC factor YlaD
VECEFEAEVLEAVLECRWPERVDAGLRAHVAGCEICSDVAAVAGAIAGSREEMTARPAIPDSGRVWWLAQRRARLEAEEAASRPLLAAQAIAWICVFGLLGVYFRSVFEWVRLGLAWMAAGLGGIEIGAGLAAASRLLAEHGSLALAMLAVLLLVPAALYAGLGRD